jgi:MtN3 and saliva related transmembrane protein
MAMGVDAATLIGGVATLASTSSFVPQAWKIIKTRETKDISAGMYGITVFGFALWLTYGVILARWPLIVTNGICFCLAFFILLMKILPPASKAVVANAVDPVSGDQ